MRFPARILGVLFAFLLVFFVSKASFAQTSQTPSYLTPNTSSDVPSNLHTWTQNVMIEVLASMDCQLTGIDILNKNQPCLGANSKTGQIGYVKSNGGLIGFVTSAIGYTYNIPVHTSTYFSMMAANFGIAKSSYATSQDGQQSLLYIQNAWVVFRNFAYILFVLVFLVIGVAIMLRVRVDPRTVMTIQNQIPKLIIGIILVTFSFAIAGLLIDFMWLLIYFMINTLAAADPGILAGPITNSLSASAPNFANSQYIAPAGGLPGVVFNVGQSIGGLVAGLFNQGAQPGGSVLDILTNPLGAVMSFIFGVIAGALAIFIVAIAILYALLRLWFSLIKAYIMVLVDVIFAPFWIVAGLLPGVGQSAGIGAWLRDLIANLAVFPAIVTMLLIGKLLVDSVTNGNYSSATSFTPPLIGGQISGDGLAALIMLGILLASPSVAETIKKALKASGPGLGGVSGAIGVGQAVVAAPIGRGWRTLTRRANQNTGEREGALRRWWEGPTSRGGRLGSIRQRIRGNPVRPSTKNPEANPITKEEDIQAS